MAVSRQEVNDEVIYRSAGVDLGKRFLVACSTTDRDHERRRPVFG
jgi:hypothetical protein